MQKEYILTYANYRKVCKRNTLKRSKMYRKYRKDIHLGTYPATQKV